MLEWLAMGGYWPFVWPAYVLALGGLAGLLARALAVHAHAMKALREAERDRKA